MISIFISVLKSLAEDMVSELLEENETEAYDSLIDEDVIKMLHFFLQPISRLSAQLGNA